MLRSKRIGDYTEARLDDFKPDTRLPVDVHLYFNSNHHILIWRKSGEELSQRFIEKYRKRGMRQVWIHREDLAAWERYLEGEKARLAEAAAIAAPVPEPAPAMAAAAEPPAPPLEERLRVPAQPAPVAGPPLEEVPRPARTEEGHQISELLAEGPARPKRERIALMARAARQLLAETARPTEPALQTEALAHAREAVHDILDTALSTAASRPLRRAVSDIWELSALDPGLEHGVNVSTLAVLFAMAFGRISQEVLIDIALAALLHDVGLTQIPYGLVQTPWERLEGRARQHYARHVDESLRLIEELSPLISPRVKPLIQQHHEKFDGTGYPVQLHGHQIHDLAQLVGMADAVISMATGRWDGTTRSLLETLKQLEAHERERKEPEFFNAEILTAVLRWVSGPSSLPSQLKAADVVRATTQEMVKRSKD